MPAGVVMPDPIRALRDYLLTVTAVTDLVDERISTRVDDNRSYPLLRLNLVPGGTVTVRDRVRRAVIDVHYYPDPTGTAPEVAATSGMATIHAALLAAGGPVGDDDYAVILDVEELAGPFDLPDDSGGRDEPLARQMCTVAVHLRPNP